jgi:hypothetical protein
MEESMTNETVVTPVTIKDDTGWYKEKLWFKIITARPFVNFLKDLINKDNPASAHSFVNLIWGLGSFFLYWVDHFAFDRGNFTTNDYMFIAGMAGLTTLSAVASKIVDTKKEG